MLRHWVALVVGLCAVLLITPRVARADTSTAHTVQVAVLALDSDDAEENADALTGALRSRVRSSQGWSLLDTTQSLGMLTAALRCPGKPIPADCEQRIAEHLKTDRFIFGYVTKGPQAGQVTAEVHLYQKSKPDTKVSETFSDNLKDQNDDTLRQRAQKILERLGGSAVGTITVKMGTENGEVIIDGEKHVPLQNGQAHVELAPGTHSVEAATKNGTGTQKRNVSVTAGKETVVDLALAGTTTVEPTEPATEKKPFPVKKAVGGALAVVGVVGVVVGVVMFAKYSSDQSAGKDANTKAANDGNPQTQPLPAGKKASDVCNDPGFKGSDICTADSDAKTHSTIGWIATPIGLGLVAAGAYLFLTSGSKEEAAPPPPTTGKIQWKATPVTGSMNGFSLSGTF
jgi:hypothetical protein